MNHFLSVKDVDDPLDLAHKALQLKYDPLRYCYDRKGQSVALLFFNSSLRTRLSTQKALFNLGVDVSVFNVGQEGWQLELADGTVMDAGKAEHVKEAAAVIGRYHDIIGIRHFASLEDREEDYRDGLLQAFREYSGVPVVNLESATTHPLQSLADLMTIIEHKPGGSPKVVLTWAPHPRALPQAVPNSFAQWMLAAGLDLTICQPEGYELDPSYTEGARVTNKQVEALQGADFVYAKNWSSLKPYGKVENTDSGWMITEEKMRLASERARFMHCLPVRRNVVVSDAVLDSAASVVLDQATNRVFAAQQVLHELLKDGTQ